MLLLGGSEQRVAQEALKEWLSDHQKDQSKAVSYGNSAHLADSPMYLYWMQLDFEARERLSRQVGEVEYDDVIMAILNTRKA